MKTKTIDVFLDEDFTVDDYEMSPEYPSWSTRISSKCESNFKMKAKLIIEFPETPTNITPSQFEERYRKAYGFSNTYDFIKGGNFDTLYKLIFGEDYEG